MTINLGINGFGRIGRVFFRAASQDEDFRERFKIVAVNDITYARTLAHLLKYDSVHGTLNTKIGWTEDSILIEDEEMVVFNKLDPGEIPWDESEVDMVLESTGRFREREMAGRHMRSGVKKVVISAPAEGPDASIIMGVNEDTYRPDRHHVISMASCTTNCLATMVKVLQEKFGINRGYMTTCHAYTNDQRLLDLSHRDLRRSRAASLSIIPTTTGAAASIGIIIPELDGRLDGTALRVPVANGSVVDLVAELDGEVTKEEVNSAFEEASKGRLGGILGYTEEPIVSIDVVGDPHSCIIDGGSTMVMGGRGNFAKVLGWYDNEWGYSTRLVDLFKYITR
jgi:glyceraldehyde-3-phosphate dehydrogenase type I